MELTILGGSAAGPNPGQGCSGYLVESGTTHVVIDLGSGTFPELRRHVDYRLLDGVVLSHGHLDHFLDILVLRYALAYNPIPADRPASALAASRRSRASRSAGPSGHGRLATRKSFFRCSRPISTTRVLCSGSASCNSDSILPCITFLAGRCAFQTASTATCSTPRTQAPRQISRLAASGSQVIVAEGTEGEDTQEPFESRGHMTPAEAGALARDAGANLLVLSHLWVEDDPFRAVR